MNKIHIHEEKKEDTGQAIEEVQCECTTKVKAEYEKKIG